MPCYEVPSYIKPYSKILSWSIPMVYVEEEKMEYIADGSEITSFIKDTITVYRDYMKTVLSKDLRGIAEKFKVTVEQNSKIAIPVEEFIDKVTFNKTYGKVKYDINLLTGKGQKLVEDVYNILDEDLRAVISTPTQWLVYIPKEKLLTRLCWVVELGGEITVRPYGRRGLLLEAEKVKLDRVNHPSLRVLKRNTLLRQRLNDYWRRLLSMQMAMEEARELVETISEVEEREGEEEVGHVE